MKNKEDKFKRLYGIKLTTFKEALIDIEEFENKRKKQSGRPQKLTYNKQLKMYLIHLKENVSYLFLGNTFGSKSIVEKSFLCLSPEVKTTIV